MKGVCQASRDLFVDALAPGPFLDEDWLCRVCHRLPVYHRPSGARKPVSAGVKKWLGDNNLSVLHQYLERLGVENFEDIPRVTRSALDSLGAEKCALDSFLDRVSHMKDSMNISGGSEEIGCSKTDVSALYNLHSPPSCDTIPPSSHPAIASDVRVWLKRNFLLSLEDNLLDLLRHRWKLHRTSLRHELTAHVHHHDVSVEELSFDCGCCLELRQFVPSSYWGPFCSVPETAGGTEPAGLLGDDGEAGGMEDTLIFEEQVEDLQVAVNRVGTWRLRCDDSRLFLGMEQLVRLTVEDLTCKTLCSRPIPPGTLRRFSRAMIILREEFRQIEWAMDRKKPAETGKRISPK